MKRTVQGYLQQYRDMVQKHPRRYALYPHEVREVLDMEHEGIFNVVADAMQFAFVVGYRAGERDQKMKEKRKIEKVLKDRPELMGFFRLFISLDEQARAAAFPAVMEIFRG